jgi:NADH:ubiquinone oxidoreductase subunit 6 (subunit J)
MARWLVIGQRNPIYSVLALIVSFFGLSGLYVLLEAPFVAVVQIIIYAGAIMVLFLFVVMLLNVPREDASEWDRRTPITGPGRCASGGVLAVLMAVQLAWALSRTPASAPASPTARPSARCVRTRPRAVHRLHVRLRGHLDPDHHRDGRRGRARPAAGGTGGCPLGSLPDAVGAALRHRRPASSSAATSSRCCCRSRSC